MIQAYIQNIRLDRKSCLMTIFGVAFAVATLLISEHCLRMSLKDVNQQFDQLSLKNSSLFLRPVSDQADWQALDQDLNNITGVELTYPIAYHHEIINKKPMYVVATPDELPVSIKTGRDLHPNDEKLYGVVLNAPQPLQESLLSTRHHLIEVIGGGTLELENVMLKRNVLLVSPLSYQRIYGNFTPNMIEIQATHTDQVTQVLKDVEHLRLKYKDTFEINVHSMASVIKAKQASHNVLFRLMYLIVGAIGLMAANALYNLNSALHMKRKREIALRLAVGATPYDIRNMLMGEALSLAMIGVVAAIAMSQTIMLVLAKSLGWPTALSVLSIIKALVFAVAICLLGSWSPAKKSMTIPIAQTLKGA